MLKAAPAAQKTLVVSTSTAELWAKWWFELNAAEYFKAWSVESGRSSDAFGARINALQAAVIVKVQGLASNPDWYESNCRQKVEALLRGLSQVWKSKARHIEINDLTVANAEVDTTAPVSELNLPSNIERALNLQWTDRLESHGYAHSNLEWGPVRKPVSGMAPPPKELRDVSPIERPTNEQGPRRSVKARTPVQRIAGNIDALVARTGLSNRKFAIELGVGDNKAVAAHRRGDRAPEKFMVSRYATTLTRLLKEEITVDALSTQDFTVQTPPNTPKQQ